MFVKNQIARNSDATLYVVKDMNGNRVAHHVVRGGNIHVLHNMNNAAALASFGAKVPARIAAKPRNGRGEIIA